MSCDLAQGSAAASEGKIATATRMFEQAAEIPAGGNVVYGLTALVALGRHDVQSAQILLAEMDHDHPLSTFVTSQMEPALPYELGSLADKLPIYVRGVAYLTVDAPTQAETEFQKIISHHSVDATTALYPLSVLGMPRCYMLQGRKAESREAYLQVFRLWKNADKAQPILFTARKNFMPLDCRHHSSHSVPPSGESVTAEAVGFLGGRLAAAGGLVGSCARTGTKASAMRNMSRFGISPPEGLNGIRMITLAGS